jgi:hypothetical protein
MSGGISFPSDQILLLFVISPIVEDLFDFPFWFVFYEVGGGSRKFGLWASVSLYRVRRDTWNTLWILQLSGSLSQ